VCGVAIQRVDLISPEPRMPISMGRTIRCGGKAGLLWPGQPPPLCVRGGCPTCVLFAAGWECGPRWVPTPCGLFGVNGAG
jgi:hypothetical protein